MIVYDHVPTQRIAESFIERNDFNFNFTFQPRAELSRLDADA